MLVFSGLISGLEAATNLIINDSEMMVISNQAGEVVNTLPSGSVSERIQADNQAFKISFGKDLNGVATTIIYPDPENPQSLNLNVFGEQVDMTEDAVLTITGGVQSPNARFQSGVLGTVTIGGTILEAGGTYASNSGYSAPAPSPASNPASAPAVSSNSSPASAPAPATSSSSPSRASAPSAPAPAASDYDDSYQAALEPSQPSASGGGADDEFHGRTPRPDRFGNPKSRVRMPTVGGQLVSSAGEGSFQRSGEPTVYEGLKVREVVGDAMISMNGQDPMDNLRNGVDAPRLKPGDRIPPGARIRTGPNSKVIASVFPGVIIQVQQNSDFGIPVAEYEQRGNRLRHEFEGDLKQGGVLSAIKDIPSDDIDFKIRTPQGVAAARGTVFASYTTGNFTLTVSQEGNILVQSADATISITVIPGTKAVVTALANGSFTQEEFDATSEELAVLENFIQAVQDYISQQDIDPTSPGSGGVVLDLSG